MKSFRAYLSESEDHSISTGLIPYYIKDGETMIFMIKPHPWVRNDGKGNIVETGYPIFWSVSKGRLKDNKPHLENAIQEFKEETGISLSHVSPDQFKEIVNKNIRGIQVILYSYEVSDPSSFTFIQPKAGDPERFMSEFLPHHEVPEVDHAEFKPLSFIHSIEVSDTVKAVFKEIQENLV